MVFRVSSCRPREDVKVLFRASVLVIVVSTMVGFDPKEFQSLSGIAV